MQTRATKMRRSGLCCAGDNLTAARPTRRGAGTMHPHRRIDIFMMFSRVRAFGAAVGVVPTRSAAAAVPAGGGYDYTLIGN